MVQYQTLKGKKGASKTEDKFYALNLEKEFFKNKSVLDLGCNEGAFSAMAMELGAIKATGIEANKEFADRAKRNFKNIIVFNQKWSEPIDGTFDIVLFLSAIHYDSDKLGRLKAIYNLMEIGGTLILECGVASGQDTIEVSTPRKVGTVNHPTHSMWLQYFTTSGFNILYEGKSIDQLGDPVPRFVFHLKKNNPLAILLGGESGTGKSTLARLLGIPMFSMDHFIYEFNNQYQIIQDSADSINVPSFLEKANESESAIIIQQLQEKILKVKTHALVIEGHALEVPWIQANIKDILQTNKWRIWSLSKIEDGEGIESVDNLLFQIDPKPKINISNSKYFELRSGGNSFLLHPPANLNSKSSIEWLVNEGAEISCHLNLPYNAQPVIISLILIDSFGRERILSTVEVNSSQRLLWRVNLDNKPFEILKITTQRAPASSTNSRSWLIVEKLIIRK